MHYVSCLTLEAEFEGKSVDSSAHIRDVRELFFFLSFFLTGPARHAGETSTALKSLWHGVQRAFSF